MSSSTGSLLNSQNKAKSVLLSLATHTIRILISFLEKRRANSLVKASPILQQQLQELRMSLLSGQAELSGNLSRPCQRYTVQSSAQKRLADLSQQLQPEGGCALAQHTLMSAAVFTILKNMKKVSLQVRCKNSWRTGFACTGLHASICES